MAGQATRDTAPELLLRRALHGQGFRYRIQMRPVAGLRITGDIVFTRARVVVFVDGCFWHRCPVHGTSPRGNAAWWEAKLDRRADMELRRHGWAVVRVWEHTPVEEAAETVARHVTRSRGSP
jgi:DNA mismatch endonuclease (patch repair protein)